MEDEEDTKDDFVVLILNCFLKEKVNRIFVKILPNIKAHFELAAILDQLKLSPPPPPPYIGRVASNGRLNIAPPFII